MANRPSNEAPPKKGTTGGGLPMWKRPGARIWLFTSILTMAVATVAGGAIYVNHERARALLEAQYSKLAAHYAEEADLRIVSYFRAASVIGSISSWRSSTLAQDALAKQIDDDLKKKAEATKESGAAQADRDAKLAAASEAIANADAARSAAKEAQEARDRATDEFSKKNDELRQAERAVAKAETTLHEKEAAVAGLDGGTPSASAVQDLQAAKQAYATALQRQKDAKAAYDSAAQVSSTLLSAAVAADNAVKAATKIETDANKTFNEADRATARARALLVDVEKTAERNREQKGKALAEAEERARLSFLPPRDECKGDDGSRAQCYAQAVARSLFSGPVQTRPDVVPCPTGAPSTAARDGVVLLAGHDALFRIEGTGERPSEGDKVAARSGVDKKPATEPQAELCLRVPISELMAFTPGSETSDTDVQNPFGELLLVDARTCRVLEWSDSDPGLRPVAVPECQSAMLPTPRAAPASSAANGSQPKESTENAEGGATNVADLAIGHERYAGFWQALKSPFRCTDRTKNADARDARNCDTDQSLVVVDLVREDRLVDQARGLSPLTFLALVVAAALAVFSWPVAKLWLVGARARFSRFDSAFLGTSALALTFIVTLSSLALVARERLTRRLDDQLDALAAEVTLRLGAAVTNAKENLRAFEEETKSLRDAMVTAGPSGPHDFVVPPDVDAACRRLGGSSHDLAWPHPEDPDALWTLCESKSNGRLTVGNGPNATLNFWANWQGYVQIQENDKANGEPPVNVGGRDYFRRAREKCDMDASDRAVAEVVRSLTSTKKVLVVAEAQCQKDGDNQNTSSVLGFETDLYRFERLDVPPGFQWAVVDREGKVMLHSSMDAQHLHDLHDDMDDTTAAVLRSATFSKSLARFDGEYRGVRSRVRVSPSGDVPDWTVVALASRGQNEIISRDTLVTTAASYGLFVLLMALVAIGFALVRIARSTPADGDGDSHLFDPRPRGDAARTYARVSARLFAGTLLLGASTLACPWIPAWGILALVGFLLVRAARDVPGVWPRRTSGATGGEPRGAGSGGLMYLVTAPVRWAVGRLSTWAVWDRLPVTYALCCFAFAASFVVVPTTTCFVGAFSLAAQSSLRTEQRAVAERTSCEEGAGPKCWKPVRNSEPRRYRPNDVPEVPKSISPFLSAGFQWPLEPLMGWFHSDYLPRPAGASELRYERGNVLAGLRVASDDGRGSVLESNVPRLLRDTNFWHLLLGAMCVVLLLLAAHAFAYLSLKRLFFMDTLVERQESRRLTAVEGTAERRMLFLFPPASELERPNLPDTTVVLRENDSWDNPHFKISRIEKASLVLSEVDPLRRGPTELRNLWVEALKDFFVVRGPGRRGAANRLGRDNRAAFMHQWAISDSNEQRVLAQLAIDGHASPHPSNASVLRHLAARGLVDDVTLTISDPAFSRYLEHAVRPQQMQAWQESETEVAWDVIRLPLVTCVALVLWLVYISHPELAESGALLLPPAAGGLPAVLRLVATLARTGKSPELTG